jgi:alpha/beta superfamily hydrolase
MQGGIVEERITFTSDDGPQLVGILTYPERMAPRYAVLLCSPHPHFAGNMDNNVICAIARGLAEHAVTLRFDYRGVGDSQINLQNGQSVFDYWSDLEETKDYTDAVRDVSAAAGALASATKELDISFSVVGYSFGAATGMLYGCEKENVCSMVAIAPPLGKVSFEFLSSGSKPSLFLIGTSDFLYSAQKAEDLRRTIGPNATVEILYNVDHFFRGDEDITARKVDEFICNNITCGPRRASDATG